MFCENCGTQLAAQDSFCTSCGSPTKASAEYKNRIQGQGKKSPIFVIGAVIVLLLILFVSREDKNSRDAASSSSTAASVHAAYTGGQPFPPWYVIAAFNDNEVKGEAQFKDRVALRGFVYSIETGALSGAWVTLVSEHDKYILDKDTLRCGFDNTRDLLPLHQGQTVTLSGERARKTLGVVFFHNCAIEPDSTQ